MGNSMGHFMGKGLPSTQVLSYVLKSLHEQFTESEINSFDDFHAAILDILNVISAALPGKHYDAPSRREVEKCFKEWENEKDPEKKKKIFMKFIKEIKLSQLDNTTIITGIVTPPAAMAAKKAGEFLPHLSVIKSIPDVVFVPSVTMATLVISKLSRRLYGRSATPVPTKSASFNVDKPEVLEPAAAKEIPPSPAVAVPPAANSAITPSPADPVPATLPPRPPSPK
ncbi:calcium ion-binding protein [Gossypium australe]|uniref:Calcium ion-binding protein n=1 Tax=Gossypium australe TaxID=47621 RepID=A0A5B6WDA9_9ROSI|nr:calcium ion-binding protein [Gossypium australe]